MKILFCNKCHKKIIVPKMLLGNNIVSAKPIKVGCSDSNCKGHALFNVPKKEVVEEVQV